LHTRTADVKTTQSLLQYISKGMSVKPKI